MEPKLTLQPPTSTFGRARRRATYRRLADLIRRRRPQRLPSLDDVTREVRVTEQAYVGVRPIAVSTIVGTESRTGDFDPEFLPRRSAVRERWQRVERTHPAGDFPPIVVYELDGRYFVVDGHHRVAVAKQLGVQSIDAEIVRLRGVRSGASCVGSIRCG